MIASNYYIKTEIGGEQVIADFYGDEIHTKCFICGREIQVDEETMLAILEDGDFSSTRISCGCADNPQKPKLTLIK